MRTHTTTSTMEPSRFRTTFRTSSLCRWVAGAVASVALFLCGCTTMQSVPVPTQSSTSIGVQVGDRVEVQTKDGRTLAFKVTQVEPSALAGTSERVEFADIAGLQIERVDGARTAINVGAVVVIVGALAGMIGITQSGPGIPP